MQRNFHFPEAELESITCDLSLGLKVKDKTVKHLTIDYSITSNEAMSLWSAVLDS